MVNSLDVCLAPGTPGTPYHFGRYDSREEYECYRFWLAGDAVRGPMCSEVRSFPQKGRLRSAVEIGLSGESLMLPRRKVLIVHGTYWAKGSMC